MITTRDITETDTRATRLQVLEAQVCQASDDLGYAAATPTPATPSAPPNSSPRCYSTPCRKLSCLAAEVSPR